MSFIRKNWDCIKEYNFHGNTEVFVVGTSYYELIGSLDSNMLGVIGS